MVTKVLCLHGFLQNGKLFYEKASGLRKLLKKLKTSSDLEFDSQFIDGPVELKKSDLPFELDDEKWDAIQQQNINKAWFYHTDVSADISTEESLNYVKKYIRENGPFDGIIGFSQGAALASILTLNIPTIVENHPLFKFSLIISGYSFTEEHEGKTVITPKFSSLYKVPPGFTTKVIHIYGANDNSVPGVRSEYLTTLFPAASNAVFKHDGGHFVPTKKDFLTPVVEEIKKSLQ